MATDTDTDTCPARETRPKDSTETPPEKATETIKSEDVTLTVRLSAKYKGQNVPDVICQSADTVLEYDIVSDSDTRIDTPIRVHRSIQYIVTHFGFPNEIQYLINGFPKASVLDRLSAVKLYHASSECTPRGLTTLLMTSLRKDYIDIVSFLLFETDVRVYRSDEPVYIYNMLINYQECTVFNPLVTRSPECKIALLRHILATYRTYPEMFFTVFLAASGSTIHRLQLFTDLHVPEDMISEFAAFLHFLYTKNPESVIACVPVTNVRGVVLTEYGVVYDLDTHALAYSYFKGIRERLDKIDNTLSELSTH